ncbi:MAG: class I SAM-dependent methyltransferase [Candidatus Aenigmatarchaeota archaeon]
MDKTYSEWNKIDEFLSQERAKLILNNLNLLNEHKITVVDVGCGMRSKVLHYLNNSNKLFRGIGLDRNTKTRREGLIEYFECDVEKQEFPISNNSVDVVISLAVLEHLVFFEHTLKEIYRILKYNGTFLFTTPSPQSDIVLRALANLRIISKKEIEDHKLYFTKQGLYSILNKVGFKYIEIKYFQLGFNQEGKAIK